MKTRKPTPDKRQDTGKTETETFYVTLPSTMNYVEEKGDDQKTYGYPDFYEDTDNMNRYLW